MLTKIKLLILTILLSTAIIPASAKVNATLNNMGLLYNVGKVPVTVNWKDAVYKKRGTLRDFLLESRRDRDWERRSNEYFLYEATLEVGDLGVEFVEADPGTTPTGYSLEIEVKRISGDGNISGDIILYKNTDYGKFKKAAITFSSDDSDDDDPIAFKDQMKDVGEQFGELLRKQIRIYLKTR